MNKPFYSVFGVRGLRELHSNGAIRLHHNMYEKEYIEEGKEEYTGTIEQYQCLTFVPGVGDNVQDNRKSL